MISGNWPAFLTFTRSTGRSPCPLQEELLDLYSVVGCLTISICFSTFQWRVLYQPAMKTTTNLTCWTTRAWSTCDVSVANAHLRPPKCQITHHIQRLDWLQSAHRAGEMLTNETNFNHMCIDLWCNRAQEWVQLQRPCDRQQEKCVAGLLRKMGKGGPAIKKEIDTHKSWSPSLKKAISWKRYVYSLKHIKLPFSSWAPGCSSR